MTQGTPAALATSADVVARWRPLTTDEAAKATTHLGDASAVVLLAIPDLVARIAADTTGALGLVAKRVVVDAVLRLMRNPHGAKRIQEQIGDRAYTLDIPDTDRVAGLFITDTELGPLLPDGNGVPGYAFGSALLATRPGWSPDRPRPRAGDAWFPGG